MKKVLAIFVLLALLLQAAPVRPWATEDRGAFCAVVDEEVPAEKSKEVKDERTDDKISPHPVFDSILLAPLSDSGNRQASPLPFSPYRQQHTPPPNVC